MINFNTGEKKGFKSGVAGENEESKGKNPASNQNPSVARNHSPNNPNHTNKANKTKEKGYKGKARLTKTQMEQYRKDNKCFKCGSKDMFPAYVQSVTSKRGILELPW